MQTLTLARGDLTPENLLNAEVTSVPFPRERAAGAPSPEDIGYSPSLVNAADTVIRDVPTVGWWGGQPDAPVTGCLHNVLVYNVGWLDGGNGHGHALYTQNYAFVDTKRITSSVFVAGFGFAMQLYGTNSEIPAGADWSHALNKLAGYDIRDSVFLGRTVIGGQGAWGPHRIKVNNCVFAGAGFELGYFGQGGRAEVTNNIFHDFRVHAMTTYGYALHPVTGRLYSWHDLTVTGNTFNMGNWKVEVNYPVPGAWAWDYNTYYATNDSPFDVRYDTGDRDAAGKPIWKQEFWSWDRWRGETGFDAHSTLIRAPMPETVIKLPIVGTRKWVFAWNPNEKPVLALETAHKVTDARRWHAPETRDSLPMTGEPEYPVGWTQPQPPSQLPRVGVFRVEAISDEEMIMTLTDRLNAVQAELAAIVAQHQTEMAALQAQLTALQAQADELAALKAQAAPLVTGIQTAADALSELITP